MYKSIAITLLICLAGLFALAQDAPAQTTSFTYQGSLKDGASVANGNYDFEFALFDSLSGGAQLGSTLPRNTVVVTNGIFSVSLDFGSQFPGANRYLEIRVRLSGQPGITTLGPRQQVNSAPYSVKSITADNAAQLGGVTANQFVVTTDPRLTDSRSPTAGSANYIQNQNAGVQATSNFNISGDGTVGGTLSGSIVSAVQFNTQGFRVLRSQYGNLAVGENAGYYFLNNGFGNSFVGYSAGGLTISGEGNSFFGSEAGKSNDYGDYNTFVGYQAGYSNTSEGGNSFFGSRAGANATATGNSFFGDASGELDTTGAQNSFFGDISGKVNTTGNINSFFGWKAGGANTQGSANSFFGMNAGDSNTTGYQNTAIGYNADVASANLHFTTAIGSEAIASISNSIYLGRPGGEDTVRVPGNLNVTANTSLNGNLTFAGGGVASITGPNIFMPSLNAGIGTNLCLSSNRVITCSSSLRYKTNIGHFDQGLNLLNKLRPITFDWKDGGMHDFGLGAEDVAAIEPRLVTYNDKGEVEGVKYDRIGVVLVNAVKEQQEQIDAQKAVIDKQQQEIDQLKKSAAGIEALKRLVCQAHSEAAVCK